MLTTHYLYFLTSHLLSDLHSLALAPTAPLYVFTKFSTYLLITKPKGYSESLSHFPYCSIDTVDHYSSLIPLLCYHFLVFLLSLGFLHGCFFLGVSSTCGCLPGFCPQPFSVSSVPLTSTTVSVLVIPNSLPVQIILLSFTLISPTAYRTSRCG